MIHITKVTKMLQNGTVIVLEQSTHVLSQGAAVIDNIITLIEELAAEHDHSVEHTEHDNTEHVEHDELTNAKEDKLVLVPDKKRRKASPGPIPPLPPQTPPSTAHSTTASLAPQAAHASRRTMPARAPLLRPYQQRARRQ